jgi:hypothetical protein
MSFGESGREGWPVPYDDAAPFFRQALDLGITFWDAALSGSTPTRPSSTPSSTSPPREVSMTQVRWRGR